MKRFGRDARDLAQLARSASGRSRTEDGVPGVAVGVGERLHLRRLAGPGKRLHRVDSVAAGSDLAHRRCLIVV